MVRLRRRAPCNTSSVVVVVTPLLSFLLLARCPNPSVLMAYHADDMLDLEEPADTATQPARSTYAVWRAMAPEATRASVRRLLSVGLLQRPCRDAQANDLLRLLRRPAAIAAGTDPDAVLPLQAQLLSLLNSFGDGAVDGEPSEPPSMLTADPTNPLLRMANLQPGETLPIGVCARVAGMTAAAAL